MLDRTLLTILVLIGLGVSSLTAPLAVEAGISVPDTAMERMLMENRVNPKYFKALPKNFEFPTDDSGELLLREYGAVFVTRNGAVPPSKIVFDNEEEVQEWQRSVKTETERIGGINIELQKPAMRALESAVKQARREKLTISPRGVDSGRRGYNQTVNLWKSRVDPGLIYWVGRGRLRAEEADRIRRLPIRAQVSEILTLERFGLFFAKSLNKSIIYSVAPPGTSQHIAMLALDVKEFDNPRVRAILAENGWFQSVVSDLPHFTYIGAAEEDLPDLGLKKVSNENRDFWVPDITETRPPKKEPAVKPTPKPR